MNMSFLGIALCAAALPIASATAAEPRTGAAAANSVQIARAGSQASAVGPDEYFTGPAGSGSIRSGPPTRASPLPAAG